MTAPELKQCPFCDGHAIGNIGVYRPYIYCECCDVHGPSYDTIEEAITAWNRRADPHDATKAQLAKAVEALKSLIQHAYNCEKELTEELHHMDFCGESLLLINARAVMAEIEKGGV